MKKHLKTIVVFSVSITIIILILAISIFLYKKHIYNKNINFAYTEISQVQERLEKINNINDLCLSINNSKVLGIIEIEKIGYKGLIYEETTIDVLDKRYRTF